MLYAELGASGPQVSRLGLGTMSLPIADPAESIRLVHRALDAGITLVDTADVYGTGRVEEVVGQALAGRRDQVVLATKVGLPMAGDPDRAGGSRRWIVQAAEDSLRRLGTDHLDLYQLHRPDPAVPIEETVAAFDELIQAGKIRAAGSSVFPAELIVHAQWAAERLGVRPLIAEQAPYSILVRGIERAVLPTCRQHGIGVIVWGPLNGGWLTGKYQRGAEPPAGSRAASGNPFVRADDETKLAVVEPLARLARSAGLSLLELSLSWTAAHPAVTSTLIGPRTIEQLDSLIAGFQPGLADDLLDAIDEIVAPGTDVDPRNAGWTPVGLARDQRRRPVQPPVGPPVQPPAGPPAQSEPAPAGAG